MAFILGAVNNSKNNLHVPEDLFWYILEFCDINTLRLVKTCSKKCKDKVESSDKLFKIQFGSSNLKPFSVETINNCMIFGKCDLFHDMMRLVSYNPLTLFHVHDRQIPILECLKADIKCSSLSEWETYSYSFGDTNYKSNQEYDGKWNVNVAALEANLRTFCYYSKWQFLFYLFEGGRIWLAGGMVAAALRKNVAKKLFDARDADIFVVGDAETYTITVGAILRTFADIMEYPVVQDYLGLLTSSNYAFGTVTTVYVNFSNDYVRSELSCWARWQRNYLGNHNVEQLIDDMQKEGGWIKFQFVHWKGFGSIKQVLCSFDLDICQVAFNGRSLALSYAARRSMETNTIVSYHMNLGRKTRAMSRMLKYAVLHDMSILMPSCQEHEKVLQLQDLSKMNRCICSWASVLFSTTKFPIVTSKKWFEITRLFFNSDYYQLQKRFLEFIGSKQCVDDTVHECELTIKGYEMEVFWDIHENFMAIELDDFLNEKAKNAFKYFC